MGERSSIEWTDATYNPWRGCDKVSPGCAHCYMFTAQRRYGRDPNVVVRAADATFYAPLRKREWKDLAPGSLVFTCSWSDWFHEDADEWRDEAWEVLRQRRDLTWQILTKRPERIADHLPDGWPWPNVWLGVSIENRRFVHRADVLREIPAAVRFISAEPLLGPLLHDDRSAQGHYATAGLRADEIAGDTTIYERHWRDDFDGPELDLDGIDWLIVGGESGPGRRPLKWDWVRDLREYAADAGTAFFLKQGNGPHPGMDRLLDGRTYDEMPTPRVFA